MSELLILLNRMKVEARLSLLTDTQKLAYDEIMYLWQFPGHVNLCGTHGVGKTIIGWVIGRAQDTRFFASLRAFRENVEHPEAKAIIDNIDHTSKSIRDTLAEAQIRSIRRTLIITTEPNRLDLPTVLLESPDQMDLDVVYHNLSLFDRYPRPDPVRTNNLWDVIRSVL